MTIEEILARKECQTFDCKSIQIDPKALAIPIVAMANADGGVLAIGVSDKTRRIEGVDGNEERLNELLRVPFDFCNPSVRVRCEYLPAQTMKVERTVFCLCTFQPAFNFIPIKLTNVSCV